MHHAPYWYALITAPNSEFAAEAELQRIGVETIVPRIAKEVRRHRLSKKTEVREFPLWSRYVFAGFQQPRPWYAVNRIEEITGAVGFEGEPMLLKPHDVRYVAEIASRPIEVRRHLQRHQLLKVGDKVRIAHGPFKDHMAELSAIRRKSAELLLEIFGSIQGVSIPLEHIEQVAA